jgi:hypothetical protein
MDLLELERRAVDEIQPQLTCLMDALNRLPDTPKDFEPNRLVLGWLGTTLGLETYVAVIDVSNSPFLLSSLF